MIINYKNKNQQATKLLKKLTDHKLLADLHFGQLFDFAEISLLDQQLVLTLISKNSSRVYQLIVKELKFNENYYLRLANLIFIYRPILGEIKQEKNILDQYFRRVADCIELRQNDYVNLLHGHSLASYDLRQLAVKTRVKDDIWLKNILKLYFDKFTGFKIIKKWQNPWETQRGCFVFAVVKKYYFLKYYLTFNNDYSQFNNERKILELNLYNNLSKKVNVPRLIANKQKGFFIIDRGSIFVLFEYIDGTEDFPYNFRNLIKLTNELVRLHNFNLTDEEKLRLNNIAEFNSVIAKASLLFPSFREIVLANRHYDGLKGLCHFDLNTSNFVLVKDKVYLLDLDVLSYNFIILDLANLICKFIDHEIDFLVIKQILDQYWLLNPSLAKEKGFLPDLSQLMYLYLYCQNFQNNKQLLLANQKELLTKIKELKEFFKFYKNG